MKTLIEKFFCITLLLSSVLFISCNLKVNETKNDFEQLELVTGGGLDLKIKSSLAGKFVVSTGGASGNITYFDGKNICDTVYGHWMQYGYSEDQYARQKDTLWSIVSPKNDRLTTTWSIKDDASNPVLSISEIGPRGNYIIVEALRKGKATITSQIEDLKSISISTTVDSLWCTGLCFNMNNIESSSNSTILYASVDDPADIAKTFTILTTKQTIQPADKSTYIKWVLSNDSVVTIEPMGDNKDSCKVTPKDGLKFYNGDAKDVTLCGYCRYGKIESLISVRERYGRTDVDEVIFLNNNSSVLNTEATTVSNKLIHVTLATTPTVALGDYPEGFKYTIDTPELIEKIEKVNETEFDIYVKKKGNGKVTFYLDAKNGRKEAVLNINISNEISSITINEATIDGSQVNLDKAKKYTATILDEGASDEFKGQLQWSVNWNESVADPITDYVTLTTSIETNGTISATLNPIKETNKPFVLNAYIGNVNANRTQSFIIDLYSYTGNKTLTFNSILIDGDNLMMLGTEDSDNPTTELFMFPDVDFGGVEILNGGTIQYDNIYAYSSSEKNKLMTLKSGTLTRTGNSYSFNGTYLGTDDVVYTITISGTPTTEIQ